MSITDELRDWMRARGMMAKETFDQLTSIADRIDAKHERAVMSAMNDALYHANDESMAELGWVRLPVDANGVPIRPGDELVIFETGEHIRAYDIELYDDGRWLVCDDETMDSIHPDRLRHHHAPTVEDVLREFAANIADVLGGDDFRLDDSDELYAEYAARLRLVGEGDACRE